MSQQADLNPEHIIKDEDGLRALYPKCHPLAAEKSRPGLDKHSIAFIERSPFLCLGTQNGTGFADVSPRGDPAGFVKVLDAKSLLIPDRPGNNRLDTLTNILSNPHIGLLFLIPGYDETMRVNGVAKITSDPVLMELLSVRDRAPKVAIHVEVGEAFIHCAKAFRRSKLWDLESRQDRSELPTIANIILDQTSKLPEDPAEMKRIDGDIENEYKTTLY